MTTATFTVTFRRDVAWVPLLALSIERFCSGFSEHVLVCDIDDVPLIAKRLGKLADLFSWKPTPPRAPVNGSMVVYLPAWRGRPELHECPDGIPWDVFHGFTLLLECGTATPICNLYGAQDMSASVWQSLAKWHAWVTSCKDGSCQGVARRLLTKDNDAKT